ncbi:MAG: hypothetical protein ACLRWP_10150 [Bilophila wadsworthia]
MPDARHANLLEPEALVELFLHHPPQGFAAASEADLPVFGTDFDLLTTLEPAILAKIRRVPLFGLWSRLLRFPARFAGTTATEYAPLPKGLEPGALLDGFRERCAVGQSLLIVKDVPEVSPLLGAGDNEAAMRLARIAPDKGFIVVEGQALAYVPIDFFQYRRIPVAPLQEPPQEPAPQAEVARTAGHRSRAVGGRPVRQP